MGFAVSLNGFIESKKPLAHVTRSKITFLLSEHNQVEIWRNFCVCVHTCSRSTMRGMTPSRWWWWCRTKLTWPAGSPPRRPPLLLFPSKYWTSMRPPSFLPTLKSSVLKRGCLLTPPSLLLLHWIQTASSSRLSGREEWQQVLVSVCYKFGMSICDHKCQSFIFLLAQTHT